MSFYSHHLSEDTRVSASDGFPIYCETYIDWQARPNTAFLLAGSLACVLLALRRKKALREKGKNSRRQIDDRASPATRKKRLHVCTPAGSGLKGRQTDGNKRFNNICGGQAGKGLTARSL
jgi:hypothetical protein